MIHVRLLGPIEISRDGAPIKIDSRKALALLGYLAVARRPVARAALLGLLWADMPEERGRANLSWTLNRLGALLPGALQADRASVRFEPTAALAVDLYEFEQHAGSADTQDHGRAIALYQGPLMDGLHLHGCAEFEHWLLIERERTEQRVMGLMLSHANALIERGGLEAAADVLARLLALDPIREDVYRQRMRLLALSGQRSAALAQYEACRRVLLAELDAEPEAETRTLAEAIRRGQFPERAAADGVLPHSAPRPSARSAAPVLIGREFELNAVEQLLGDPACRLVTIVGFGGMGKTRLALALAERVGPLLRDRATVVHLAAIDSPAHMPAAIAEALGIDVRSQADPRRHVIDVLRGRELLLVLDNIEHLLEGADLLAEILAEAPGVRLLATSQERLGLREECVYDLRGLRLPASDDPEAIAHSDAVRLFVRQARRVRGSFALDDDNRDAVARICRALWGHPLAIEVAASWVRTLSCAEIAQEIESGAGLLKTSGRDLPPRHRSARSVFEYSWARLAPAEQRAFALLSVFPTDFSREAASAVLAEPEDTPDDAGMSPVVLLAALVEKSLLMRLRNGRFVLHELLRSFAAGKLTEADSARAHERHWRFYGRLLCSHEAALRGADQGAALQALGAEFAHIRAAWLWAARRPDELFGRALDSLLLFYDSRGWFRAGVDLFAETAARLAAAEQNDNTARLLGRVRTREGMLLLWLGQYAAASTAFAQGLKIAQAGGDRREQALSLAGLGFTLRWLGDLDQAEQHARTALDMARGLGDRWLIAVALQYLALIARDLGKHDQARALAEECRVLFAGFGYHRGIGFAMTVLGLIAQDAGQYAEAERMFQEGLDMCSAVGDPMSAVIAEHYLGRIAFLQGQHDLARRRLERALAESDALGYHWGVIRAQTQLGAVAQAEGNMREAENRLITALARARELGAKPLEQDAERALRRLQGGVQAVM